MKTRVVLQELPLRFKLHAVTEATEVEALHLPAVLIHAVSANGRFLKELLRAVPTHESLKTVTVYIAAVLQNVLLRVKDVLTHPAHPRLLLFYGGGIKVAGGSMTSGRLSVKDGSQLLGHFLFGEISVPSVVLCHVRQDVFISGHFDLAFAAVEEEVGEMRSPVKAAHV